MNLKHWLLDFFYPISCLHCGQSNTYLCQRCSQIHLNYRPRQRCGLCNQPSITGSTHSKCQTPYQINGVFAITARSPLIMKFLKQIKYRFSYHLTKSLHNLDCSHLPLSITQADLLIPIPLHPRRLRWRGFNHAEKITQVLSHTLGIPYNTQLLIKTRHTVPQAEIIHRHDRQQNLQQAFHMHPQAKIQNIKNKHLVLVDDITTTGATLTQAAIPLKRAGAASIWGLVITR